MLQLKQVSKQFTDRKGARHLAVDAVDITIRQHEIIALVGTSGCGKSTLLRMIAGLDTPTHGRVTLGGNTLQGPHADIAMVFQEPRLMPWLSVRENVRLVLSGVSKAEQDARIEQTLKQVQLWSFRDALPRQLSGGMAQRAAIARALVCQPNILLLDEPFSALDNFTRESLQQHVLELWAASQFTLVIVTHDIEEAVSMANRVLVMKSNPGHIQQQVEIPLPYPRDPHSAECIALKRTISAALKVAPLPLRPPHESAHGQ